MELKSSFYIQYKYGYIEEFLTIVFNKFFIIIYGYVFDISLDTNILKSKTRHFLIYLFIV